MNKAPLRSVRRDKALAPKPLEWTGERFLPEVTGDVALEHVHRYLMAREMASGRVVLDIASGEGYGSALLAEVARRVVGVDLSSEAVEHAARKYTSHNLRFALGSCSEIPLPDDSIDLAVSFETIEHHDEHELMMKELKRVLRPRGKLIISSPDKYEYADRSGHHNGFHVRELYRHEFEELVKRYFTHVALFGQRALYGSTILREDGTTRTRIHQGPHDHAVRATRPARATYWIAVASDVKLGPGVSTVLEKPLEDIVRESKQELAARNRDVHELSLTATELQQRIHRLGQQVKERDHQIRQLTEAARVRDLRLSELNGVLSERSQRVTELTRAVLERDQRIQDLAAAVDAHERTIDELTRASGAREERIRALGETLGERDDRIATLSRTLSRRENQMGALKEETRLHGVRVNKFREEALPVTSLREQVRVFENSKSWRLTAPLRAIGQLIRRMRHLFQSERSLLVGSGSVKITDGNADAPLSHRFPLNQIYATRFVANEPAPIQDGSEPKVRALAFYLPQYHAIAENDAWWGEGFTDWDNVRRARSLFTNHEQPRTPFGLGYYDSSRKESIERQAALIRAAGLEGVCIYYYWFNGKRLLEKPLEMIHENPDIDLNYCLCWANENWTRAWDGSDNDVLIAQNYSEQDDLEFIAHISEYFSDRRYIRVHGKPLLMIYRLDLLPDPKASTARWRQYCLEEGIGDIFVMTAQFTENRPEDYGADAGVEFPPHRLSGPAFNGIRDVHGLSPSFDGGIHDYNEMALNSTAQAQSPGIFRTVTMGWDNTARRRAGEPTIFINCTPARYERWLSRLCRETKSRDAEERLVLINAWNEWAEGVYLEPDRDHGYAYINATQRAVTRCEESIPRVAVVLHLFYWDLVDELAGYISNIPFPFDLYVTATEGIYSQAFSYFNHRFPQASVNVVEVENRARDIGPFLTKFTSRYGDYDLLCKVHTKKSPHAPNLSGWRTFLLERLLGSGTQIREIVEEFDRDPELGLLYPTYYPEIRSSISWGPNRYLMRDLLSWLQIDFDPASPCIFPAGSMFWFRPKALSTLIDFDFLTEEFPEETGQTDGTLAHAIERGFLFVVEHNGYRHQTIDLLPGSSEPL